MSITPPRPVYGTGYDQEGDNYKSEWAADRF